MSPNTTGKRKSPTDPQLHTPGEAGQVQYLSKLPEKLNKGSFAKGVGKTCVEGKGRVILGEDSHPTFLKGEDKTLVYS